jgi:hypothetical protein
MTWVGVNSLPPVGLMVFSVGDGATVDVVVVVVVVVVLEGACLPPPQAAVNAPMVMIAVTPAMAGRRRAK